MGLSKLAEKSLKDLESFNMFREVFRDNK
jgi:hypothetical protein